MPRLPSCFCRGIRFEPSAMYFKPQGVFGRDLEIVELSMEEFETYRLCYVDDLGQIEASDKMGTSQSTYQRILQGAHKKIADALVNSKAIKIIRHE